jgi:hypothetical protein
MPGSTSALLTWPSSIARRTYQLYRDAISQLEPFALEVARRQFDLFNSLRILEVSVKAMDLLFGARTSERTVNQMPKVLLFTGHRVDGPGRKQPRFPADQEETAHKAIREAIAQGVGDASGHVIALAGGASGGDLLFLEECEKHNIGRHLYLVIPRDEYVAESASPSGPSWVKRFDQQYNSAVVRREYQMANDGPRRGQGGIESVPVRRPRRGRAERTESLSVADGLVATHRA